MRVVFVCSGNYGVTALVKAQADSLVAAGIDVLIYPIVGKGLMGYLRNIQTLRQYLSQHKPDLVHAHYSLSGLVTMLSTKLPVVVSLMGSDVNHSPGMRALVRFCSKHVWKFTIVKSDNMKAKLGLSRVQVVPNGVNLELFKPLDKVECRSKLNWKNTSKHILFVSSCDPGRLEKNLRLAKEAVNACNRQDLELHIVTNIDQMEMPIYLNASDLLLLTSKWEGSPNTVKEAMACNIPVVATKVGDIETLFIDTSGYYIGQQNAIDLGKKIDSAIAQKVRVQGRERINSLSLDSVSVANILKQMYLLAIDK